MLFLIPPRFPAELPHHHVASYTITQPRHLPPTPLPGQTNKKNIAELRRNAKVAANNAAIQEAIDAAHTLPETAAPGVTTENPDESAVITEDPDESVVATEDPDESAVTTEKTTQSRQKKKTLGGVQGPLVVKPAEPVIRFEVRPPKNKTHTLGLKY